jgi:hypothetical protein
MTNTVSDVTIYLERRGDEYRVRYEFRIRVTEAEVAEVRQRMRRSFSLGRNYPDARTVDGARQKGRLMAMLMKSNFGYSTDIVEVFN